MSDKKGKDGKEAKSDKKDGKDSKGKGEESKKKEKEPEKPLSPVELLKQQVGLLRRATETQEPRFVVRALRKLNAIRESVSGAALRRVGESELIAPADSSFLSLLPEDDGAAQPMETEDDEQSKKKEKAPEKPPTPSLEVEAFLHLLTVVRLLDDQRLADATATATQLVGKLNSFTKATLNPIAAKAYFYYSRAFEGQGGQAYANIRSTLLAAHITASLQHANEAQMTLLNLLLRNYLHFSLFDQADKLATKSGRVNAMLQDGSVSSNQVARYLYYVARIKAVQLAYGTAFECLEEALRKAPRDSARGFRLAAHKLLAIVQLLMGEIPERSIFMQEGLSRELRPYFLLAKAVRVGDLEAYNKAVAQHSAAFARDETLSLTARLRHNVIKTGLRKICVAYSRIGFADICEKLRLDSPQDAEYMVAKAIRDGVVEATIDHGLQFMQSAAQGEVYCTTEPYEQLHRRIEFCNTLRSDAVKALRFPEAVEAADVLKAEEKTDDKKQGPAGAVDDDALDGLDDDLED